MGDVIYLDLEGYHRADCLKGNKTAGCSGEVEQAEVIDVGSSKLESEMVLFGSAREADSESRLQEQFLGEELGRGEESGCLETGVRGKRQNFGHRAGKSERISIAKATRPGY